MGTRSNTHERRGEGITPTLDREGTWSSDLRLDEEPPCEIIHLPCETRPYCPEILHPAQVIAIKSCRCHQLICRAALDRVLSNMVEAYPMQCQKCSETHVVLDRWFAL